MIFFATIEFTFEAVLQIRSLRLLASSGSLRVMKYGEKDIGNNDGEGIGDNTIIMMMVFMKMMVMMMVVMREVMMRLYIISKIQLVVYYQCCVLIG